MKTKNVILAGLASVLLAACTSDMALEEQAAVKCDRQHLLKVEVVDSSSALTRAVYSGFPSTSFETGDAIGVYAFNGSSYTVSNIRFVKQSDGSWTPDEEVPYNEDYTYYAYFPYRNTTYSPNTWGTVDDIDAKFAYFISDASNYFWKANQSAKADFTYSNLMIAKGTVTDTDDDAVTIKFTMAHKRGLAVFTGDAPDATFTGNIPYLVGSNKHFLMKPGTSTSFTDDAGTYSLSANAGVYVRHNITIPTIDLSMVDNAGNERASRTTANCYLVHAAGRYMIPLVYGNAIKNGAANTVAYLPGGSTTSTYCRNFVNHAGSGITGPWITKSGSGVDGGMGLTAASAELLWQDANGLISKVSIDGDYLKFTVGTFTGGNALIAVKDGSGTILWSWHIWATDDDLSNTTVVATGSHNYTVAPVNLGWVPTGGGGKQGYCPFYQWGRKDPFIPGTGTANSNHTVYNINGATVTGLTLNKSTTATIADNIKNPTIHYYNSSNYGPVNTTYNNMWDAQNTATDNVATATKKTIYDPCPPGFCVPTGNLCYFFGNGGSRTMSTFDSDNKGATWDNSVVANSITGDALWFPVNGYRNYSSPHSPTQFGLYVHYWSATPMYNSTNASRTFQIRSYAWYWTYSYRAIGDTIRPVVEE